MSTNTIAFTMNPSVMASNLTIVQENGTLWSLTGRLPGSDDDHTHFVLCNTYEEAVGAFTYNAYDNADRDMPYPGDEDYREGEVIYITDHHELGVRLMLPVGKEAAEPSPSSPVGEAFFKAADFAPGLPDTLVSVTAIDGSTAEWLISQNLTDRWGEINEFDAEKKPLHELLSQPDLLGCLRDQMTSEVTFVARKDGVFGLLYEVEYQSIESEGDDAESDRLKPHEDVVAALITAMQQNTHRFPGIAMCVPSTDEICNDRPAVWAFVPNGALHEDARNELANFLNSL